MSDPHTPPSRILVIRNDIDILRMKIYVCENDEKSRN